VIPDVIDAEIFAAGGAAGGGGGGGGGAGVVVVAGTWASADGAKARPRTAAADTKEALTKRILIT
jgi:hypothetical protein